MTAAAIIISLAQGYCVFGGVVALVFLTVGIDRIDEDARGAYAFRSLLIPALLLIWPLVLWRWWVLETDRDKWQRRYTPPRRSHRLAAVFVAVAVVVTIAMGVMIRQTWPADVAPVLITPPGEEQS